MDNRNEIEIPLKINRLVRSGLSCTGCGYSLYVGLIECPRCHIAFPRPVPARNLVRPSSRKARNRESARRPALHTPRKPSREPNDPPNSATPPGDPNAPTAVTASEGAALPGPAVTGRPFQGITGVVGRILGLAILSLILMILIMIAIRFAYL